MAIEKHRKHYQDLVESKVWIIKCMSSKFKIVQFNNLKTAKF